VRIARFRQHGVSKVGLVTGNGLVDLTSRIGCTSVAALLTEGLEGLDAYASAPADAGMDEVSLLPPVGDPTHIVGVGLNTRSHFRETLTLAGREHDEPPKRPRLFMRSPLSHAGHGEELWIPRVSKYLDYEGELAIVVGRRMRYVPAERALDFVAGYSCYNDGSVRDYQMHTSQATNGKSFPRSGSFGPWIVTADEAPPLENLRLTTSVNGELRQSMDAADLIFDVPCLLAYISCAFDLQPGDVVLSGSPAGSGGMTRSWLTDGDTLEVSIAGIGLLSNRVRPEPA